MQILGSKIALEGAEVETEVLFLNVMEERGIARRPTGGGWETAGDGELGGVAEM